MHENSWICFNCSLVTEDTLSECSHCGCPNSVIAKEHLASWRRTFTSKPIKPSELDHGPNPFRASWGRGPGLNMHEQAPCPRCEFQMSIHHATCPHCAHKLSSAEREEQLSFSKKHKFGGLIEFHESTPVYITAAIVILILFFSMLD